jgi:Raf kinase inhibitor-like YbhB/YbcL family protein
MRKIFIIVMIISLHQNYNKLMAQTEGEKSMELTSTAFTEGGMIPAKYTCDGMDISPPLSWENIPEGTKSFAIICDDPDAPVGIWVHWVIYNLLPEVKELSEAIPAQRMLADGSMQGLNDFRKIGYGGPCPPGGTHRYYFKLYALDIMLDLEGEPTKSDLEAAMQGHILKQCQIMGRYKR